MSAGVAPQAGCALPQSSGQEGHEEGLVFRPVKEHRGAYFVEYVPARGGDLFASLALVFVEHAEPSKIAELMESECRTWMQRYKVPLMVTAFDDTDSVIPLASVRGSDHLIGIPEDADVAFHWRLLKQEDFPSGVLQEPLLKMVYGDIPFTTLEERRGKTISSARAVRMGFLIIAMWLIAVPVCVKLIGVANPLLGYGIFAFAVGKAIFRAIKMLGYVGRSEREKQRDADELRMRHHHYHCELNPEGFLRLKVENFEREAKEATHREAAAIGKPLGEGKGKG